MCDSGLVDYGKYQTKIDMVWFWQVKSYSLHLVANHKLFYFENVIWSNKTVTEFTIQYNRNILRVIVEFYFYLIYSFSLKVHNFFFCYTGSLPIPVLTTVFPGHLPLSV
jgi:hypothetical protein